MKKRTCPSVSRKRPKMATGAIPDHLKSFMISPDPRAKYLHWRPPDDKELRIPMPVSNINNHPKIPVKNSIDSKVDHQESTAAVTNQRLRLFGVDIAVVTWSGESSGAKKRKLLTGSSEKAFVDEDVVTESSDLDSLSGSSSAEETLDLFPVAPAKIVVDLVLSVGR